MVLAKIAGNCFNVSKHAAKVIKGADLDRVYRAANGFNHKFVKFYDGPNATLTRATKILEDGRRTTQNLWSWPDGHTVALTTRSDGFVSYVAKNAEGHVYKKLISKNPSHLVYERTAGNGPDTRLLETYVNGDKGKFFINKELVETYNNPNVAKIEVKSAIDKAKQSFGWLG